MKIGTKLAIITACLCVILAALCVGLYWRHRNREPGRFGKDLEFRLAAFNTEHLDQPSRAPTGPDVFSGPNARRIAESGEAPAGFEWLPVSDFLVGETGGVQPRGITRVIDGREFLLVAVRPGMILTHSANVPPWGVKSVQMTATYKFGPVVQAVQIELDYTAARMLRKFTQKYAGHSVAVIVDGQVIMNATFLGAFKGDLMGFRFPETENVEAETLRDSLMK